MTKQAENLEVDFGPDLGLDAERDLADLEAQLPPDELNATEPGEEPAPYIPVDEFLAPAVEFFCDSIVPNWGIKPHEKKMLADSYGKLIEKYAPNGIKMGPEFAAALATFAVFGPRIAKKIPPRLPDEDEDEQQQEGGEIGSTET